jgi:cellulose synthase/poly-beta-1,6-N-acetylglucosamine synthase-like glycosyltransferase
MVLGGSAGLKGNGMVFTTDILRRFQWSNSVTEDIDYHMQLILADVRVFFAPDAVVSAEMPDTAADAASQNERWEQGRLDMLRRYVPALLRRAAQKWWQGDRRRAFLLFDATMEHFIPPFSILTAATGLSFVTAALAFLLDRRRLTKVNVVLGLGNTLGQIVYLLAGLRLAGAPRAVYKALLSAPFFIVWKIALYLRIVRRPEQPNAWVRTARNDPAHTPAQESVWPANAPR